MPNAPETLPTVRAALAPADAIAKLATASRRGRLPGFIDLGSAGDGHAFEVDAYATPFDYTGAGVVESDGDGCRIRMSLAVRRKIPAIFAVTLVVTLWPGILLTDSMIDTYWGWHARNVETWWWYVPSWVLSLPVFWSQWKKSARVAHEDARATMDKLAKELGGSVSA